MPRSAPWFAAFLTVFALSMLGWTQGAGAEATPAAGSASSAAGGGDHAGSAGPAPRFHWTPGPASIELGHDITLALPERHAFLAAPEAGKLLEKMGSFHNESLLGIVVGKAEEAKWFVTIDYRDEGYVKDSETIDQAALLEAIQEGTEEENKERVTRGFKALHVGGWSEAPHYDRAVHHLVWALTAADEDGQSVNFNTRVLGRRGIVSLDLVCGPEDLAADKPEVALLLANTAFKKGARYEDFDSKTDKVAQYGLAGLILGGVGLGAAKLVKIGLIAKFWKVILAALIAGKKAILLAIAGAAAFVKRLFGRKKAPAATPSPEPPPPQAPPPEPPAG